MNGALIWFTGLPSSGKSCLARRVRARLGQAGRACCVLDGDRIRDLLCPRPGYSDAERDAFYQTLGGLAAELTEQGLVVLVPATAHRREYRDRIRARVTPFIEVWVAATPDECRERDAKGLYAHFAEGAVRGLPGEDSTYEAPLRAEVTARGGKDDNALEEIMRFIQRADMAQAK